MTTIERGIYPASVTPFLPSGEIDYPSVARLLAYFESAGCKGVVVGGTNGEGPSLSAVERRDLCREAVRFAGELAVIQGIATASLPEAIWLCEQAGKCGARAALVMPPGYFRSATDETIVAWFHALFDRTPIPILVYNFPKMTGITLTAEMVSELCGHQMFGGLKDSSGSFENLVAYRNATKPEHSLLVGNETLLLDALSAGWTGSISGAANLVSQWLSRIVMEWDEPLTRESAQAKFQILMPVIEAIRSNGQPAMNKSVLEKWSVISDGAPRLPLQRPTQDRLATVLQLLESTLGIRSGELGLTIRQ